MGVNSWTNHFFKIWQNQTSCLSTKNTPIINSKVIAAALLPGHINKHVHYGCLHKKLLL